MVGSLLQVVGGVNWLYLGITYRLVRDGVSLRYLDCTILAGTQFYIKRAHALILQPLDEQSNDNKWGERIVHSLYNYYVLNNRNLTKVEVSQIHKSRIMCRSRKRKAPNSKVSYKQRPSPQRCQSCLKALSLVSYHEVLGSLIILES